MSEFSPSRPPRRSGFLRRFNVVLLRAADLPLLAVVRAVREVTRFAEAEAMSRMWDAVHTGRAVVLSSHLERAELFAEQLAERGLSVAVEPA